MDIGPDALENWSVRYDHFFDDAKRTEAIKKGIQATGGRDRKVLHGMFPV